ncbi:MAG: bifunctional isocitrate dehydrogenase kinase/phosphatase [Planctomycetota bacterium]
MADESSAGTVATATLGDAALAKQCAVYLHDAFLEYNAQFRTITRRAKGRFERRDWKGGQRDAAERIDLYDEHVQASVAHVRELLGERAGDHSLWEQTKLVFAATVSGYPDVEFTKTYFSSVSRRVFGTAGVDAGIQFTGEETIPLRNIDGPLIGRNYHADGSLEQMFDTLLADYEWNVGYVERARCATYIAMQVREHYARHLHGDTVVCVDMLTSVFYRDTRAYVIGKATGWTNSSPLVIALENSERGIAVDAVIQTEETVAVMFGFARSYFHVDLEPVGSAIVFLRKVVPRETVHELFTILGRAKQGKTERFRGLERHLRFSRDGFVVAPGKKGMVMAVFTLPSYDVVFKVIRDRFPFPKDTSHDEVKQHYKLVARHDKAGRLVDAQEFRMLRFDRSRFEQKLLDELLTETARTTRIEGDSVVIAHAYIERRLRPLDLYLREVDVDTGIRAVLDFGQALRDLAATNIFPGDILLKNWGVGRTGRVVFYDYDELCLLTDCVFRDMPVARTHEDEMSAEPWFSVGANDVFPEQWPAFLGMTPELLAAFCEGHGELLTAKWWRSVQDRLRAGEVLELLPY